jgi:RNA 2',3'-cyclic 3'-phosphodiesterase
LKNRLFVSLNLPDNVIGQIISLRDNIYGIENINWEPKNKLHLTIKFIGDVSKETMTEISNGLHFIERHPVIKCSFNKFGFFYRDDKPFILWAGLTADKNLNDLITEINKSLVKFSIPVEQRRFNPHITLLRIKNDPGINFVNSFKNFTFEPILFTTNSVTLYKSILHPMGSEYIEIKNYKLKELEK